MIFILISIAILLGIYIFWRFVFLTFPFITGPWLKFLHLFDSCYTSNTHQNLVALWAKACVGNMGFTKDTLSQYYLPPISRIFCKRFVAKILYGNMFKQSSVISRANAVDKGLQQAIDEGMQQFIIVGSGFDIRPFRFAKQGIKFIELDLPHVIQQKQLLNNRLVKKFPHYKQFIPTYIPIDLIQDRQLNVIRSHKAFDKKLKTCIISEAVLGYLEHKDAQEVLNNMAEIADTMILFESKEPIMIKNKLQGTDFSKLQEKNMNMIKCEIVPPHKNAYYAEFVKK